MKRPYFQARIDELESLVRDQGTPRATLVSVQKELAYRHTWRAQRLRQQVQRKLSSQTITKQASQAELNLDLDSVFEQGKDTKLSKLNLSTRARNVVIAHQIETVFDLSQYSEAQLFRLPNVGRKTINEFRSVLRSFGLRLGGSTTPLPFSREPEEPLLLTQIYVEEPADLRGALLAHVRSIAGSERNTDWTIRHLGWDGRPGRTLESIGSEANVTRERVRQIAAKCCRALKAREEIPKRLKSAVEIVRLNAPLTQGCLDELLKQARLADHGFSFKSLASAASVFGIPFPYCELGGQDPLIIEKRYAQLPAKFLRSAKLEVAAHGAIVDEQLTAICSRVFGSPIASSIVHSLLRYEGSFQQVAGCDEWWWRPRAALARRNRLVNTITKILAVCPRISVSELREACRRHVRTNHIAPPSPVLRAICSSLPIFKVDGQIVERIDDALDWNEVLNSSEILLCAVFKERPVLDSLSVSERGIALGINENSLGIYKTYSPLLWRPTAGFYALVGGDIPVGLIEELERRRGGRRKSAIEFGWTSSHTMLLARRITDGVWLSGILSLPAAVQRVVTGDFSLHGFGAHELGTISIKKGNAFGFKSFLRMFGAEVGDIIVTTFDPKSKRCEAWLGGSELLGIVHSGPDAVLAYLAKASNEEAPGGDAD